MKHFYLLLTMLIVMVSDAKASVIITVEEPGELSAVLSSVLTEKITNLTIRGKLNASDIKVLRAAEGKLATLDTLDVSDVTFVPSDEPYYSYSTGNDGSFAPNIYRFFISEEVVDTAYMGNSLSQANPHYYDHYDPYLSGAFAEMSYKRVVLPRAMTCIGIRTFWKCRKLEEVIMETSPSAIGESAFSGCNSLVTSPDLSKVITMGEMAFNECSKLQKNSKGEGIDLSMAEIIPDKAFRSCYSLKRVKLSDQAKSIGYESFSGCRSLTEINIPPSLYRLSWSSFRETSWLKQHLDTENSITYLGNVAIEADQSLTSLNFRDGTLGIADNFLHISEGYGNGMKIVTSIQLPSSVLYIGKQAFEEADVTSVILPDGLAEIGDKAFNKCGLKHINIPTSLKRIGQRAFAETLLENVDIPNHVEEVGGWAFYDVKTLKKVSFNAKTADRNVFQDCDNLTEAIIGSNTSGISIRMFWSCDKLEDVDFGPNINYIGESAFSGCTSLKMIDLPNSLQTIGAAAFANCDSLKEVVLPEGLISIEGGYQNGAFEYCDSLKRIVLPSTLQSIGKQSFSRTYLTEVVSYITEPFALDNVFESKTYWYGVLTVPKGTTEAYRIIDGWKSFANIVEMISLDPIESEITVNTANLSGKDLSDNEVEGIYYNVGEDGFDTTDGSIVIGQTTDMNQIVNAEPSSNDIKVNFTGMIFKVTAGKGKITLNAKTIGNAQLVIQVGDSILAKASQAEKNNVTVNYDVTGDTYVYIYATFDGNVTRSIRASSANEVRIYDLTVKPGENTGISYLHKNNIADSIIYNIAGQRQTSINKGIKIVRYNDGTVRKVISK